jgi:hypothetical protein
MDPHQPLDSNCHNCMACRVSPTRSTTRDLCSTSVSPCPLGFRRRINSEYAMLRLAVLRACKVSVTDIRDVEHTIDVTAETLYEAVAAALAALQQDSWVGEISQGLNTVRVLVQQPPVEHEVKMKNFLSWLGRQGGSPAEIILRQKVEKMLGQSTPANK